MNIEKAIKTLEQDWASQETGERSDYQDAVRLGIEALKRVQASRVRRLADFIGPLPGETKD